MAFSVGPDLSVLASTDAVSLTGMLFNHTPYKTLDEIQPVSTAALITEDILKIIEPRLEELGGNSKKTELSARICSSPTSKIQNPLTPFID